MGGTPILGVNGIIYKCHGNSKARPLRIPSLKHAVQHVLPFWNNTKHILQMEVGGAYDEAL